MAWICYQRPGIASTQLQNVRVTPTILLQCNKLYCEKNNKSHSTPDKVHAIWKKAIRGMYCYCPRWNAVERLLSVCLFLVKSQLLGVVRYMARYGIPGWSVRLIDDGFMCGGLVCGWVWPGMEWGWGGIQ